ncbi:Methionine aminopeptidase [Mycoplasmopsis agalactiae 14628]|uniref:Methionine aminopeptidase n=1 Tax=Mycoplasmopsis agalactiae 14628 TaxID=1110504 RepID=I5D713_MYCAA|nr:type I methionyl aminopeptidase [Mycoplasmopsis agalactiae]EIN15472.1 Methionine aminopeptidase [Mycoplasmopsis agalactiae 14628]
MVSIKSSREIELISKSCQILAEVKAVLYDLVRPGISLKELDRHAFNEIIKRGAKPAFKGLYGFPATACISVNDELIHGIPSNYVIKDGDIVKIDLGCDYNGYKSDSAFTKGVGKITESDSKIIEVAKLAFEAGLAAIKPGARVGDISYAIGEVIKNNNLYTPKEYTGHGIGKELHEDPYIPNEGKKGTGIFLKDNMVICIEPMILQKSNRVYVKKDKWTVVSASGLNAAHYEHTVLIKNGKGVVLTKGI